MLSSPCSVRCSGEVLERAARVGAIDLHPSAADLDEAGPGLGGAPQHGFVDRGVVDHDLPVDQGGRPEPAGPLGRPRHRRGGAAGAGPAPGEPLGRHQIDAHGREQFDRLERGRGLLDVDLLGALGLQPVGQPRRDQGEVGQRLVDGLVQQRQVTIAAGQLQCRRGIGQHLGQRTGDWWPGAATAGVDQLERQRPGVVALVGQTQTEAGAHDGLALGAPDDGVERVRDLVECVHQVALVAEATRRRLQCTHHLSECPADGPAGVAQAELPTRVRQGGPGDLVDERVEHGPGDRRGIGRRVGRRGHRSCHHCRHGCGELRHGQVGIEAQRRSSWHATNRRRAR